ncbi:WD40-repeat-containing domain protein [Melampsora americana]|nr:WD40-repeat-containing domain protein [Melampsora americana]
MSWGEEEDHDDFNASQADQDGGDDEENATSVSSATRSDNNNSSGNQNEEQDDDDPENADDDDDDDQEHDGREDDDGQENDDDDDDDDDDEDDDEEEDDEGGEGENEHDEDDEEEDDEDEEENRSNSTDQDDEQDQMVIDSQSPSTQQQLQPSQSDSAQPLPLQSSSQTHLQSSPTSINIDSSQTLDQNQNPANSYIDRVSRRRQIVTAPRKLLKPPLIDPLVFIPHGCPVHALALPPCGSHLFSGGQDGFIRRIAIYESVTGSMTENLTMRQGGHVPLIEKEGDKTTIFLTGYWENEDNERAVQSIHKVGTDNSRSANRWGPKSVGNASKVSPVYSLAVQSEELWGLSGTESGNINLFTIRHDEGQIRHVFKSISGHRVGSVISALELNHDQNIAFSGGWDGNVLGWDLNTGQVVNRFIAHASQISTVTMRPDYSSTVYDSKNLDEALVEEDGNDDDSLFAGSGSDGVPDSSPAPIPDPLSTQPPQVPSVSDSSLPLLNENVLLTSGIDGQVYLWDRRIQPVNGKGLVRKLDLPKNTAPWTSSVTWSIDGQSIFVGRRHHSIDVYDLRFSKTEQRTIRLPVSSGPVSCVKMWPDGNGLVCASFDNVRLWNLKSEANGAKIPFRIIPGNSSGVVSSMSITPSERFLITASGDRGWENISNECVVIHEVRAT